MIQGLYPNTKHEIVFVGNTFSSTYINQVIEHIKGKSVVLNVISKSGTTTETALAFRILREYMEELILYGNQIKNISALSKLCKLRVLKLEGNLIEDVEPLLNLKNLEKLSLGDNPVKNVQLLEFI